MKIKLLACALVLAASSGSCFAQLTNESYIGTFGLGVELDGTGALATNSGTTTLYELDNSGGSKIQPAGSTATLSTAWGNSSSAATPTFNLGTFVEGINTLTLTGGGLLTYQNSGAMVNQGYLVYGINSGTTGNGNFTGTLTLSNQTSNLDGTSGDTLWSLESGSTNLLAGLNPGTYTLEIYGFATNNTEVPGDIYDSNSGGNYAAEFTIVPEPSTWAMMFGGLGFLLCFQRLRRKSVA